MWLDTVLLEVVFVTCCTVLSGYRSQSIGRRSPQCSNQGELVKGLCACYPGYSGYDCSRLDPSLELSCINPNASVEKVCSGRGQCVGGRCECAQRRSRGPQKFTGEFCECDDYSCPFHLGDMCGGTSQGTCLCGRCMCRAQYSGEACGCSAMTDGCVASDGTICNNQGNCVCGYCQCRKDGPYRGTTCEELPASFACEDLRQCVQCRVFQTGPLSVAECANHPVCSNLRIHSVKWFKKERSEYLCEFKDEDDCIYRYGISYEKTGTKFIQAGTVRECVGAEYSEPGVAVNPVQSDAPTGYQDTKDTDKNGSDSRSASICITFGMFLAVLLKLS